MTPYTLQRVAEMLRNFESLLSHIDVSSAIDRCFSDIKPLNAKLMEGDQDLQVYQDNAFIKLETAIDDGDTVIKSMAETSSTDVRTVLKSKKIEHMEAVRVAMVDFQNAFDCERDARLLVVDRGEWLAKHRLDYIQSLYIHVNMLSKWDLYWKLSSKGEQPDWLLVYCVAKGGRLDSVS